MTEFTFYQQVRRDGGVRTGLYVERGEELQSYDVGETDDDPTLRWYIDLRGGIEEVADGDTEGVRQWLAKNSDALSRSIRAVADELVVGVDPDVIPLSRELDFHADCAQLNLVVSASRIEVGRGMGENVKAFAESFSTNVAALRTLQSVA